MKVLAKNDLVRRTPPRLEKFHTVKVNDNNVRGITIAVVTTTLSATTTLITEEQMTTPSSPVMRSPTTATFIYLHNSNNKNININDINNDDITTITTAT